MVSAGSGSKGTEGCEENVLEKVVVLEGVKILGSEAFLLPEEGMSTGSDVE